MTHKIIETDQSIKPGDEFRTTDRKGHLLVLRAKSVPCSITGIPVIGYMVRYGQYSGEWWLAAEQFKKLERL